MKKKQFLASMMAVMMLASSAIPVYADGLAEEGDTGSAQTNVSFTTTSSQLGGVVVSVPETLVLSYDDSTQKFSSSDSVYAYGQLGSKLQLEISSPATVKYSNQDVAGASQLTGTVEFVDDTYTGYWSSEQLYAGVADDHSASKKETLKCTVNETNGIQVGTYKGEVNFTIKVSKDLSKSVYYDTGSGVSIKGTNYAWNTNLFNSFNGGTGDVYMNDTKADAWLADSANTTLVLPSSRALGSDSDEFITKNVGNTLYNKTNYIDTVIFPAAMVNTSAGLTNECCLNAGDKENTKITTIYMPAVKSIMRFTIRKLPSLTDVYYAGSATEFENAILSSNYNGKDGRYDNESLWNATIHVLDESDNWVDFDKNAFFVDHPTT